MIRSSGSGGSNNIDTRLLSEHIPAEMKERKQWVCYTLEPNKDGHITKIPREPRTGARAKINDPSCWTTFEDALSRIKRYAGLEYMLSADDPFTFVDLDHCIDETTGEPLPWAQKIINHFDSYTELSQSGHGIHIIGKGSKPGPRCRIASCPGIELYDSARPIVMTGNLIHNAYLIQPCGNEIAGLYLKMFGEEEQAFTRALADVESDNSCESSSCGGVALDDIELIKRACAAEKNGSDFELLWNGNTSTFNNDSSAADQALCNHLAWWTNRDAERIDRLFRLSGLMREKWEKRPDYRKRTIDKAIRDTRGGYTGAPSGNRQQRQTSTSSDGSNPLPLAHLTDLGNAEYLIANHGTNLRYDVDSGRWLHWCGSHWQRDDTGKVDRITRETIRSMYDLLKNESDQDRSKKLYSHIIKSESRPRIEAMIALARYCDNIPTKTSDIDNNQWQFNCINGTIDLRTGKLHEHKQTDLITKISPVEYDPTAQCPRWMQFLNEVFQDNQETIDFVKRTIGYCLTGDTREESVFILYGRGQCGKSKFIECIRHILGDYIKDTPVTTFLERKDTNTADLASLAGSRLVTASEAENEKQSFNEPLIKKISGRDPVTCRYLYQDFFTYMPTYKVLITTNDVPKIKSQDYAMKRRVKVIPFKQRFYDPEDGRQPVKDDTVGEKLQTEIKGILKWAVEGCLEWQQIGLAVPPSIRYEINALFDQQDPLAEFISDCMELDSALFITTKELWRTYHNWCEENKLPLVFKQSSSLSRNLQKRDGINPSRDLMKNRILKGIGLKTQKPDEPDRQQNPESIPHEDLHGELYGKCDLSGLPGFSDFNDDNNSEFDDEVEI